MAYNFKPPKRTAQERSARKRGAIGWRGAPKRSKFGTLTRAGEKAEERRHEVAIKADTRRKVWARSEGRCELLCGLTEAQTAGVCDKREHEQDEVIPRSLTRGLPPEERFSTANTCRTCACCHKMKTDHLIGVFVHDDQIGVDGDYDVVGRHGEILRQVRRIGRLE